MCAIYIALNSLLRPLYMLTFWLTWMKNSLVRLYLSNLPAFVGEPEMEVLNPIPLILYLTETADLEALLNTVVIEP